MLCGDTMQRSPSLWLLRRHFMLYVRRHIMLYVTKRYVFTTFCPL